MKDFNRICASVDGLRWVEHVKLRENIMNMNTGNRIGLTGLSCRAQNHLLAKPRENQQSNISRLIKDQAD